MLMCFAPTA